jgi:hypothetical protein
MPLQRLAAGPPAAGAGLLQDALPGIGKDSGSPSTQRVYSLPVSTQSTP